MLPGVSKTAILTLRARAEEHARADRLFADPLAVEWFSRVEWPVELDAWYRPDTQSGIAMRADDIDQIVRRCVASGGVSQIVELGAGLSTRRSRLSDLSIERWFDVDLPEVIELRLRWGALDRHDQIAASVLDERWMDRIDGDPARNLFIAEGLLYYLARSDVDVLLKALRKRFSGSLFVCDVVSAADHPKLLEQTRSAGTPIQWSFKGDFDRVLDDLGLGLVEDLSPDRLSREAAARYWSRFDKAARGLLYFSMHQPALWASRSGNVAGRL